MIYAEDDVYVVFHTTEAGSPDVYLAEFGRHGWVFEPSDWEGGVYSKLYDTKEAAELAADDSNTRLAWEAATVPDDDYIYHRDSHYGREWKVKKGK